MSVDTHGAVDAGRRSRRALWSASALGGMAQSVAGTAGTLLAREVGGSDAVAGLPQTMQVGGSAIAAVALAAMTVRRGRRFALCTGTAAAVVASGLVVLATVHTSLVLILAGSVLIGAGNTAVMLSRYAAADLGPESARTKAMGTVLLATTAGAVLGPNLLVPGTLLSAALGLPPFAGSYVIAAAGFAVATAVLAEGLPRTQARPDSDPARAACPATVSGRNALPGLVVLGLANLVMVGVMTMASVQMQHGGSDLWLIGLVVSAHIAAMFAPSVASAWLTERIGNGRAAATAGVVLVAACGIAVAGAGSPVLLLVAMIVLGAGWNLALISGSGLLTAGVPEAERPRREGWGEVAMGVAAAGGGGVSGPIMSGAGYSVLALTGALVGAAILPAAWTGHRERPAGVGRRVACRPGS